MGCADLVPGVSGGTMAFILGIYEELVLSIRAGARAPFWKALLKFDILAALNAVNAKFLAAVLVGIVVAVLSFASGLEWMLENRVNQTSFKAARRRNDAHPIEEVGEKLRAMMPWISEKALVDKSKN